MFGKNSLYGLTSVCSAMALLALGAVASGAPSSSLFSSDIVAHNPVIYYQMDEIASGTFPPTVSAWGNISMQGGGSAYADTEGSPLALNGGSAANKSMFSYGGGGSHNVPPDGGASQPNSAYGTAVYGNLALTPTDAFSGVVFIKALPEYRKNLCFFEQAAGDGTINGSLDILDHASNSGDSHWALFAADTDGLTTSGAALAFEFSNGTTNWKRWTSSVDLLDGQWHLIGFIYDGAGNCQLFNNGQPVTSTVTSAGTGLPAAFGSAAWSIGNCYGGNDQFCGLMDDWAVFTGANNLTPTNMAYLFSTVPVELSRFKVE